MVRILGFKRVDLVLQVRNLLARRDTRVDGLDGAGVRNSSSRVCLADTGDVEPPVTSATRAKESDVTRLGPAYECTALDPERLLSFTGAHVLRAGVHVVGPTGPLSL